MAKRRSMSTMTATAIIAVVILGIFAAAYIYGEYFEEAAIVYKDSYEKVTLGMSDARSGEAINPAVTLEGTTVSYGPIKKTAVGGEAEFTGVPKGDFSVKGKLTGFYDLATTDTIQSTEKNYSNSFSMDNVGTFGWGDTSATGALTADENNQIVTVTVYLNNTVDDTVIKDVRVKLTAAAVHENITFDDLECTTHSFEEDELAAEKWIISGTTIGDLDAEVDKTGVSPIVVVKYRMTLDVGAAGSSMVMTVSIQDLDGTKPKTSASKTITLTAA